MFPVFVVILPLQSLILIPFPSWWAIPATSHAAMLFVVYFQIEQSRRFKTHRSLYPVGGLIVLCLFISLLSIVIWSLPIDTASWPITPYGPQYASCAVLGIVKLWQGVVKLLKHLVPSGTRSGMEQDSASTVSLVPIAADVEAAKCDT